MHSVASKAEGSPTRTAAKCSEQLPTSADAKASFETIELNAPAGIPDYCRRYGPSLSALSAANPSLYWGQNLARILAQWGKALTPEQVAARMRWRDRRLAALRAHQRSQPAG